MNFLKKHWIWLAAIGALVYFWPPSAAAADANADGNFNPGGGSHPAGGATGAWYR